MSEHTKEPWSYTRDKDNDYVDLWGGPDGRKSIGEMFWENDAHRALVCVNALAGYNPEAVKEVVEAARKVVDSFDGLVFPVPEPEFSHLRDAFAKLDGEG